MTGAVSPQATIGFLGPSGTFTEEALRSDAGLARAELRPLPSFVHVLSAVTEGTVDYGFVALENSIEGTVSIALDQLVFERDLIIVGEVVLPVTQNLLALPGTTAVRYPSLVVVPACDRAVPGLVDRQPARGGGGRGPIDRRGGAPGGRRRRPPFGCHRHRAGRPALRAGGPGPRDRGPGGQLHPLRAGRPSRCGDPGTDGSRQNQRRVLSVESTIRGACMGSWVSFRPGISTW